MNNLHFMIADRDYDRFAYGSHQVQTWEEKEIIPRVSTRNSSNIVWTDIIYSVTPCLRNNWISTKLVACDVQLTREVKTGLDGSAVHSNVVIACEISFYQSKDTKPCTSLCTGNAKCERLGNYLQPTGAPIQTAISHYGQDAKCNGYSPSSSTRISGFAIAWERLFLFRHSWQIPSLVDSVRRYSVVMMWVCNGGESMCSYCGLGLTRDMSGKALHDLKAIPARSRSPPVQRRPPSLPIGSNPRLGGRLRQGAISGFAQRLWLRTSRPYLFAFTHLNYSRCRT